MPSSKEAVPISSNFERYLFDLLGRDSAELAKRMSQFKESGSMNISAELLEEATAQFMAARADDDETLSLIKEVFESAQYVLDPHTAVGMKGAKKISEADKDGIVILLATAHPAKFPDAVERAIGIRPDLPEHLSDLFDREEIMIDMPNDRAEVQTFVKENTRA